MSNIKLKNISTAKIVLSIPSIRFSRTLTPGRVIPLTEEEYQEFTFDSGCMNLLNGHYVKLFGIEKDQEVVDVGKVYEKEDIEQMLETLNITAFARFIPTATTAEKETVVKLAVEKGITNNAFVTLIQKYCNIDIINAINMKHQAEEK